MYDKKSPASALGALLDGKLKPIDRPIVVPRLEAPALLRLLTSDEEEAVLIEVADWLRELAAERQLSIELLNATGQLPAQGRLARYTLARAVRDTKGEPFGTFDEWSQLDNHVVGEVFQQYMDLVAELDPLRRPLTDVEAALVDDAAKKNDATLFYAFGLRRLVAWLTTTAGRPAS